jgi:hypothetical protein
MMMMTAGMVVIAMTMMCISLKSSSSLGKGILKGRLGILERTDCAAQQARDFRCIRAKFIRPLGKFGSMSLGMINPVGQHYT